MGRGVGRTMFAAVLLMIGGSLSIVYGIAAIGNSRFFMRNTHYVFASLKGWGWITLIVGIFEVTASLSLFRRGGFGRWYAVAIASLAALDALLSIPAYPLWSLAVFALSLWIIQGLLIYGDPVGVPGPYAPPPTQHPPYQRLA